MATRRLRQALPQRNRRGVTSLYIARTVLAYLDPGTGSMLVQLLVGGVAAVAVTAKFYWHRILTLLRIRKPAPERDQDR